MKLDNFLNKKFFKLFGFPIYGWFILMAAIFILVYFTGNMILNSKIEESDRNKALFQIDSLKFEHNYHSAKLNEAYNYIKKNKLRNKYFSTPALNNNIFTLKPEFSGKYNPKNKELPDILKDKSYLQYRVDRIKGKYSEMLSWLIKTDPNFATSSEDSSGNIKAGGF